ncbi:Methylosome subunit pICln [Coemansia sp. RSA 2559]|nr:Methylosome subunit pICln [Coemansia sp. RSA 2559]KAJ2869247.1 Methylosome subunit pICln [Coemansia erecta]
MTVVQLRTLPKDLNNVRFKAHILRVTCDPPSTVTNTLANGLLCACEDRLLYFSNANGRGFSLDYQSIVIHAISHGGGDDSSSNDNDAYLYCQLDGPFPGTSTGESDGSDGEDDEQFAELRFYPEDDQVLDDMFKAMSECAARNPDQDESEDDEEEKESLFHINGNQKGSDGDEENEEESVISPISSFDPSDFITSPEQLDQLTPKGRAVLAHLESVISNGNVEHGDDDGRFDNATEDDN